VQGQPSRCWWKTSVGGALSMTWLRLRFFQRKAFINRTFTQHDMPMRSIAPFRLSNFIHEITSSKYSALSQLEKKHLVREQSYIPLQSMIEEGTSNKLPLMVVSTRLQFDRFPGIYT
jgi:hypothetical protein